jgi:hypothetical protein
MDSVSRAARSLDAQPILAPTVEVCATQEILADVLKALPQGSAAGPSGWTYENIKAATTTSKDA